MLGATEKHEISELASRIGVTRTTLYRRLSAKFDPSLAKLAQLAEVAFSVTFPRRLRLWYRKLLLFLSGLDGSSQQETAIGPLFPEKVVVVLTNLIK